MKSASDNVRLLLWKAGETGMARFSMRGDVRSTEPVVEPGEDTENEEKGVSGLDEGADRSSSPRP